MSYSTGDTGKFLDLSEKLVERVENEMNKATREISPKLL
jgi:hypothetical protein